MSDKNAWYDRWLARLPNDRVLTRLLLESFREHRWKYLAAVVAMVLVALCTAASAWMMGRIIDTLSAPSSQLQVISVGAGVALIFMFRGAAMYAQEVLMARAGNRIVAQKQMQIYERMLSQGMAFYSKTDSSELLLRVTKGAEAARRIIDSVVSGFVRDVLTLAGLVAVMVYQQPALSMISIVVAPIVVLGIQRILKQVRLVMSQEMAGMGEIIKVIQETSGGARIIKAFNLEDRMHGRMNSAVDTVESRANRMKQLQAATMPLLDTVAGLAVASIVILSATPVFGQEPGSAGQLMSFVTAFLMSYEPASRLSKVRVVIESGMIGVRMMYNLLDEPQTLVEAPDAVDLVVTDGEIAFDEVGFNYVGNTQVLQNLSVTFAAGKTTALVGPSGGGKSSIMNLILRLYDPKSGVVRVDGQDLKTITFRSLRENIAFVGQDTFLFSGTVRENLLMAKPDATDKEIETAAKVANAHDFIMLLPKGYLARIGENGSALSGGQRQRLSIARAILRDAPILLLDEATSALDSHSEASVKAAIETISNKRTTIIIAHRLSTVLDADQICYVECGEVVEWGSFEDLMAMGGKFKDLFDAQYKNYDPSQTDAIED